MILEIHTIDVKQKPKDKEAQILVALEKLLNKIDVLNENVRKLPEKPPETERKKYPFSYLVYFIGTIIMSYILYVNKFFGGTPQPMM
jgi:hypothetical protein